jgi:ATP-dependent DNA ligase
MLGSQLGIDGFTALLVAEVAQRDELPANAGRQSHQLLVIDRVNCRWVSPELVSQFEYVEWTPDGHLRHSRFVALREDKDVADVRLET